MSIKEERQSLIQEVSDMMDDDTELAYNKADTLIRSAISMGRSKAAWKTACNDYVKNRKNYPDNYRWAILQWCIAANIVNN